MFIRNPYNYDVDHDSFASGLKCDPEEGRTKQEFAKECDINEIVRRFGITGELPNGVAMPSSGDFEGVTDFHSAMNLVRQAQDEFLLLPAEVRARFNNDPGQVLAFLEDGRNRDEAMKLGLISKPVEKTRDAVQAIDELAAKLAPSPASP